MQCISAKMQALGKSFAFQKTYCESLAAAIGMNNKFRIQVESYEELPPWSFVYNADGSDRFLKDDIIMLKVCDLEKRIAYYPVFPEKRALNCSNAGKWQCRRS